MDADYDALERKKQELLSQAAEIETQLARKRGMFRDALHFSEIEDSGHKLGQLLGRLTQARMAREQAAEADDSYACPECGRSCKVKTARRKVTGIDGPVELLEPKAHCPDCRRAFFPSA